MLNGCRRMSENPKSELRNSKGRRVNFRLSLLIVRFVNVSPFRCFCTIPNSILIITGRQIGIEGSSSFKIRISNLDILLLVLTRQQLFVPLFIQVPLVTNRKNRNKYNNN